MRTPGKTPRKKRQVRSAVVWFTGLPGSGKSTIADRIARKLAARGMQVERLDGDEMRRLFPHTGFRRKDREEHLRRAGFLASLLEPEIMQELH